MPAYSLQESYDHCLQLAKSHYENFPVASTLLPKRLRQPVAVIYAFARIADDIADEGEASSAERLCGLAHYATQLTQLKAGEPSDDPVFIALADVIARHKLPRSLFHDLLSAFRQDITQKRYTDFPELLDYCRRSANPVGRLLLHLNGDASAENLRASDSICSALQLINFLQDLQQDYRENNRIYLPKDEMQRFGINESWLEEGRNDEKMHALIAFQVQRIEAMMIEGAKLGANLKGRFGLEIRLIIAAGFKVVEKLSQHRGDVFARPRLGKTDYLHIVWQSLFSRSRFPPREAHASS
jgi:squalene synthase HpnC